MQRIRWSARSSRTRARLWFGLLVGGCLLVLTLPMLSTLTSGNVETKKAAYLQQGHRYFRAGQYQEAKLAWQNVLQLDPTLAEAHYHLGLTDLKLALWQDAFTAFHTSVRLASDLTAAQPQLGEPYLLGNQVEHARTTAQRGVEHDPTGVEGYLLTAAQLQLGELYLLGNQVEHARTTAQRVVEHDPTSVEGYLLLSKSAATAGDNAEALRAVQSALQLAPERLDALLLLGAIHFRNQDLTQAERVFRQAGATHPTEVKTHLALGNLYQATGRWSQAEAAYRTALQVAPQSSQAHVLFGHHYAARDQVDTALDHFQQALDLDPTCLEAKKHLVYLFLQTKRVTQAARLSVEIRTSQPRDLDGLYLQGRVQLAQREVGEALQTLQRVVDQEPAYHFGAYPADVRYWIGMAYYHNGQFMPAYKELSVVLAEYPTSTPLKLLVVELALRLGEPRNAMHMAREVVQAEPRHLQAILLLGQASLQADQLPEAAVTFQTATRMAPQDPRGYYGLGLVYQRQQRLPEAITAFDMVLTLEPEAVEAFAHITSIYQALGQPQQARQRCTAHLARVPHQAALHQVCGQLLLAQQHETEAEHHLTQALVLDPKRPEPHFYLGVLAEQQGNYAQACARYEQALALAPQFALAANNLAWLYAEHGGDLTRATALAEMARDHLPQQAHVLDTLGWIYYKQKRWQRAILLLQASVQKAPTHPTFHFHLGMAYYQAGELDAAQRALEQALALDAHAPNAQAIQHVLATLRQ